MFAWGRQHEAGHVWEHRLLLVDHPCPLTGNHEAALLYAKRILWDMLDATLILCRADISLPAS